MSQQDKSPKLNFPNRSPPAKNQIEKKIVWNMTAISCEIRFCPVIWNVHPCMLAIHLMKNRQEIETLSLSLWPYRSFQNEIFSGYGASSSVTRQPVATPLSRSNGLCEWQLDAINHANATPPATNVIDV